MAAIKGIDVGLQEHKRGGLTPQKRRGETVQTCASKQVAPEECAKSSRDGQAETGSVKTQSSGVVKSKCRILSRAVN